MTLTVTGLEMKKKKKLREQQLRNGRRRLRDGRHVLFITPEKHRGLKYTFQSKAAASSALLFPSDRAAKCATLTPSGICTSQINK